jgi:hypothetical protein
MFSTKNPLVFAAWIGFLMCAIVHNIFLASACLVGVDVAIPGSVYPSSWKVRAVTTLIRLRSVSREFVSAVEFYQRWKMEKKWKQLCWIRLVKKARLLFLRLFFLPRRNSNIRPRSPRYRGFMITFRHTALGRSSLDVWSARRRDF